MQIEKTVFICYRRTNVFHAIAVYQALSHRGYDKFLDFESIDSGSFEQIILAQIAARAHFIILLTPSALERCSDPNDWLRREIEYAMAMKRNIVPLFFEHFDFIAVEQHLHGKLSILPAYNGVRIPADYFEEAIDRLQKRFLNIELELVLHPVPQKHTRIVELEQLKSDSSPAPSQQQIEAEEHYEAGVAAYYDNFLDRSIQEFGYAIALNPEFGEAYYRRGHAHRMKRHIEAALLDWKLAVKFTKSSEPMFPLYWSGILRLERDYDEAIPYADEAIQRNPTSPEVYANRASILEEIGNYSDAAVDYNKAIELNPQNALFFIGRGHIHNNQSNYEAAISDYTEAIKLSPQNTSAFLNRGIAFNNLGEHAAAINDYTEALRINPHYVTAYSNRGNVRASQGDIDGAIADYDTALAIDPQYATAYNNRGAARYDKGDLDGAIEDYTEAIRINPNYEVARRNLEMALRERDSRKD